MKAFIQGLMKAAGICALAGFFIFSLIREKTPVQTQAFTLSEAAISAPFALAKPPRVVEAPIEEVAIHPFAQRDLAIDRAIDINGEAEESVVQDNETSFSFSSGKGR